ncbi:MAG: hypothetical protein QM756_03950 [Polyangiaceae bacterium]
MFEFSHHLRATPTLVLPYVAFSRCPFASASTCPKESDRGLREAALAAGDLAKITDVGRETFKVTNNTCQTLYLRVAAQVSDFGGSGGAGSSDDAGAGGAL